MARKVATRATAVLLMAVCSLLVAVSAAASATPSPGPEAGASRACHLTRYEQDHLGTTYVISLRVSGTRCSNGKKVVRAYHACRRANGGRDGRCRRAVFGYSCSERRLNVIPTQFDGRVRCKKSGREIFHKYTQNT